MATEKPTARPSPTERPTAFGGGVASSTCSRMPLPRCLTCSPVKGWVCALLVVVGLGAGCGDSSSGNNRADAARQAAADAGLSVAVQDFFALSTRATDATYVVHYTVTAASAAAPAY